MKKNTNKNVSVYLSSDLLSVIDEIANKAKTSRSSIFTHFLQRGLKANKQDFNDE